MRVPPVSKTYSDICITSYLISGWTPCFKRIIGAGISKLSMLHEYNFADVCGNLSAPFLKREHPVSSFLRTDISVDLICSQRLQIAKSDLVTHFKESCFFLQKTIACEYYVERCQISLPRQFFFHWPDPISKPVSIIINRSICYIARDPWINYPEYIIVYVHKNENTRFVSCRVFEYFKCRVQKTKKHD